MSFGAPTIWLFNMVKKKLNYTFTINFRGLNKNESSSRKLLSYCCFITTIKDLVAPKELQVPVPV